MSSTSRPAPDVMTAVCLMDALCEFESQAILHRVEHAVAGSVGLSVERSSGVALGYALMDLRSEQGSFSTRQDLLDMVDNVDAAWDRVVEAGGGDTFVCFDFEFCPEAIRLRFSAGGLTGDDLTEALAEWGIAEAEAQEARFAAHRAALAT